MEEILILVVDDDLFSQFFLQSALKYAGFQTLLASNGYEALEICKNNPAIDLILLDIHMPGFSGFETIYEIRKLRPDMVVIAETADISQQYTLIDMGFDSILFKPINVSELLENIKEQLHLEEKIY